MHFWFTMQLELLRPSCIADVDITFSSCGFFFLMATLWNRAHHYILPCGFFYLLLLSCIFFPCLISAVGDWISTILPHMVWPLCKFRMQVWNVLHMAHWKYRIQKIAKKSPSVHHRTTLSDYIFATKEHIENRKKTCYLLQMSPQHGELWRSSGWDRCSSLGHPRLVS